MNSNLANLTDRTFSISQAENAQPYKNQQFSLIEKPEPTTTDAFLDAAEAKQGDRFLRLPEVMKKVGVSKQTIYGRMKDGTFPQSFKNGSRLTLWLESQIDAYMNCLMSANRAYETNLA